MSSLEIKTGAMIIRGSGTCDCFTRNTSTQIGRNQDGSAFRTLRPVVPYLDGYFVFDTPVRSADLMAITDATVIYGSATFLNAFVCRADPGSDRNGYHLRIEATSASTIPGSI